jgi:archaeosine-15-forming tRNA-guanine transglycosylase
MKPKTRVILEMAIEEGVRRGYSRAHKHVENPTEGAIIENIEDAVMSAIHEYFTFDESEYQ